MKIYVDFNDLDAEDLPSSICNKYKLEVKSINGGSEYKCDVLSIEEHDAEILNDLVLKLHDKFNATENIAYECVVECIKELQGEKK